MYIWNYVFQIFMKRYWNDEYRCIPVFMKELEGQMLADFRHTEEGFNSIILSSNQGLTDRELMGVLLHEACHHIVFEKHGCFVYPHGEEWQEEMRHVGFTGKINRWTDGVDFFTEEQYKEILNKLIRITDFEGKNEPHSLEDK